MTPMMSRWLLLLGFLVVAGCTSTRRQPVTAEEADERFDWNAYESATFADHVRQQVAEIVAEGKQPEDFAWNFDARPRRMRVRLAYAGSPRLIRPGVREFIERWNFSVYHDPRLPELFRQEIGAREGEASYWLPMQESLLESFNRELRLGDYVDLYVVCIGSVRGEWVFLVNGFRRVGGSRASDPPSELTAGLRHQPDRVNPITRRSSTA